MPLFEKHPALTRRLDTAVWPVAFWLGGAPEQAAPP